MGLVAFGDSCDARCAHWDLAASGGSVGVAAVRPRRCHGKQISGAPHGARTHARKARVLGAS